MGRMKVKNMPRQQQKAVFASMGYNKPVKRIILSSTVLENATYRKPTSKEMKLLKSSINTSSHTIQTTKKTKKKSSKSSKSNIEKWLKKQAKARKARIAQNKKQAQTQQYPRTQTKFTYNKSKAPEEPKPDPFQKEVDKSARERWVAEEKAKLAKSQEPSRTSKFLNYSVKDPAPTASENAKKAQETREAKEKIARGDRWL